MADIVWQDSCISLLRTIQLSIPLPICEKFEHMSSAQLYSACFEVAITDTKVNIFFSANKQYVDTVSNQYKNFLVSVITAAQYWTSEEKRARRGSRRTM
ncbi:hypothetical protein NEOLEDRAFT_1132714 [Neolentinus lepideus HHB14362 ss-1]|uniref:Uncharacterized protein n=1 Tax=Neolentinus lepideus HHB14362 ss-1 TaxID=1314782 RepID=A0A165T541_9AGAM|nr:hypothetical protein NEOLEDRAFT_1132714 [Neolentinus lepideus HHB14362 ss-1]